MSKTRVYTGINTMLRFMRVVCVDLKLISILVAFTKNAIKKNISKTSFYAKSSMLCLKISPKYYTCSTLNYNAAQK